MTGFKSSFPIKCLTPRAHVLEKIAQFNFLPQGGHFYTIEMDCLLFHYAMLTLTEFNLPNLNFMIMPREQLAFPCLLTEVLTFYGIDLENEILPWEKKVLGQPPSTGCFFQDITLTRL